MNEETKAADERERERKGTWKVMISYHCHMLHCNLSTFHISKSIQAPPLHFPSLSLCGQCIHILFQGCFPEKGAEPHLLYISITKYQTRILSSLFLGLPDWSSKEASRPQAKPPTTDHNQGSKNRPDLKKSSNVRIKGNILNLETAGVTPVLFDLAILSFSSLVETINKYVH